MADHETTSKKILLDRLLSLRQMTIDLRDEVNRLAPDIALTDEDGQAKEIISAFVETSRQLVSHEESLMQRLRITSIESGNLSFFVRQLDAVREAENRNRRAFTDFWRSTVPIQVKAALQDRDMTEDAVWEYRWGKAASRARSAMAQLGEDEKRWALSAEQEQALLTLRYTRMPFSDVARILDVSPPLILNRQSDLETEIVIRLLQDYAAADKGFADSPVFVDNLLSRDDSNMLTRDKKPRSVLDARATRIPRYTRFMLVKSKGIEAEMFLQIIPAENEARERSEQRLSETRLLSGIRVSKGTIVVLYLQGKDEFRFSREDGRSQLKSDQIIQEGYLRLSDVLPASEKILEVSI